MTFQLPLTILVNSRSLNGIDCRQKLGLPYTRYVRVVSVDSNAGHVAGEERNFSWCIPFLQSRRWFANACGLCQSGDLDGLAKDTGVLGYRFDPVVDRGG